MTTHTRLYDTHDQAMAAIERLHVAGIEDDAIGLVSPQTEDRLGSEEDTIGAATTGSGIGAVLGGGAGVLAGVGLMAIPGLGPVVAAGWLAATLTGVLAGAVAGGVTGGIVDALTTAGVAPVDAEVYAEGIRRGGTLVTVRVPDADDGRVIRVLDEAPTLDVGERGRLYREEGWTGFDPVARQVAEAERQRSA
ncbi:hypothetical protein EYW49_04000 [Siculibacillus lacustris]|uniref:DUF1269 domain-containing protein n=1 Tax=Siculibacillus lacustris TaxID=1549641 RepID=A0A4Q9VWU9_9HYPH|nr:hypothetical protein [Siculibacillus lacustris]TBW40354.1 hypothetical protein EYW49_04000 [Siculibacillus lacustris]